MNGLNLESLVRSLRRKRSRNTGNPCAHRFKLFGCDRINQDIDTLLFCVLPFFSRVGFSFLDLHGLRTLHGSRPEASIAQIADKALLLLGVIANLWKPTSSCRRSCYLPESMSSSCAKKASHPVHISQ